MNIEDKHLWSNLSFKTRCYRKNFDLITDGENIITEYSGVINELRITERKPPNVIGEYGFSVWNIEHAKMLNINVNKLIKEYGVDNAYLELNYLIENGLFDVNKYKKIVIIHSLIIRKEYRKRGVTEEFIESIYRDYFDTNTLIIAYVIPVQNNSNEYDFYSNHNFIENINFIGDKGVIEKIPASEYYSLNELYNKEDVESNEYRVFSVAAKCGFERIAESHLFKFFPEKTLVRMLAKYKNKYNVQEKQY